MTRLIYLLTIMAITNRAVCAADDSQNSTPNTSQDSSTPTINKKDTSRIIPSPQASRIKALEADLKKRHLSHQILTLEAAGTPFLALYETSVTDSTQGCVILLHADNEHPDWPDAIAPLRNALPQYSWCTLSIEVPDIIKRATPIKATPASTEVNDGTETVSLPNQTIVFARMQAALAQAKSNNVEQLVFLGYKTGASYALSFLAENQGTADALVLIDTKAPNSIANYDIAQKIKQIPQPILDYYVDNSPDTHQFALWRQQTANQRPDKLGDYIQLDALPDRANGNKSKQLLIQRVRGFLKQNTQQIEQQKSLPEYKKGLFYKSP